MTFHSKDHYIKSFPSFEWNKQQSKGLMPVGMWCRGLLDPDSYPYMTRHLILCLRLINNYTHPIQNFQAKYPNTLVKKLNSLLLGLALSGFFLWIVKCLKATARKKRYNLFSPVYHCHIDQTVQKLRLKVAADTLMTFAGEFFTEVTIMLFILKPAIEGHWSQFCIHQTWQR